MDELQKYFVDKIKDKSSLIKYKETILNREQRPLNYSDIIHDIYSNIGFIPSVIGQYIIKPGYFNIFRCRSLSSLEKNNDSDELVSSFSYPPKRFCQSYGRCNLPDSPVFYGASDAFTASKEIGIEPNQKVYLSNWDYNEGVQIKFVNLLYDLNPKENATPKYKDVAKVFKNILYQLYSTFESKSEEFQLINEILYEIFTSDKDYMYSSALANYNLFENSKSNFILYPSKATQKRSYNIAVNPKDINQNILTMKDILLIEVKTYKPNFALNCNLIKSGKIVGDRILWNNSRR